MKPLAIILLSIFSFTLFAQNIEQRCHTDEYLNLMEEKHPGILDEIAETKAQISTARQALETNNNNGIMPVITIPTVVHVVYSNQQQNISDAQVLSQIEILNEDFRATNADISIVDTQFTSIIADAEIEFCLATVDPQGNPTDGINRVETTTNSFDLYGNNVKNPSDGGVAPWDPSSYLNMWVCNLGGGLLGYATPPGGIPSEDGVVCLFSAFGDTGFVNPPYDLGRTATHEIGHYLSLAHPWGNFGGCSDDDGIADTPFSESPHFGCPSIGPGSTTCNSQDCFYVFMDYCDDACLVMFSEGQKADMVATLNSSRSSLLVSEACGQLDCTGLGNIGDSCIDSDGDTSTITAACECEEIDLDCPMFGNFGDTCIDVNGVESFINSSCECQEWTPAAIVDANLSLQNTETFICDNKLEPIITIVNEGDTLITYFEVDYNVNGAANQTQYWNGTLNEGQSVSITLFNAPVSSDVTLNVAIGNINNENGDVDMSDNDFSISYTVPVYGQFPLMEAFEETAFEQNGWNSENVGNAGPQWESAAYGSQGSENSYTLNNEAGGSGELDYLEMPYMDLLGKTNISLQFDYAYANIGSVDELSIEYSIDCGMTWEELWSKQGNDLATSSNAESPFIPVFDDWAQEYIDLDFLNDQNKVATRFRNMSGGGSAIFIDNININFESNIPAGVEDYLVNHSFGIYPNPSLDGVVHLFTSNLKHQDVEVLVFNIQGEFISQQTFKNYSKIDMSNLSNGYYFIQFVADGQMATEKLLLAK